MGELEGQTLHPSQPQSRRRQDPHNSPQSQNMDNSNPERDEQGTIKSEEESESESSTMTEDDSEEEEGESESVSKRRKIDYADEDAIYLDEMNVEEIIEAYRRPDESGEGMQREQGSHVQEEVRKGKSRTHKDCNSRRVEENEEDESSSSSDDEEEESEGEGEVWVKEMGVDSEKLRECVGPQYSKLFLQTTIPVTLQHLRSLSQHLSRRWAVWRLWVKVRRGQPWLCTLRHHSSFRLVDTDRHDHASSFVIDMYDNWNSGIFHIARLCDLALVHLCTTPPPAAPSTSSPDATDTTSATSISDPASSGQSGAVEGAGASEEPAHPATNINVPEKQDLTYPHRYQMLLAIPPSLLKEGEYEAMCGDIIEILEEILSECAKEKNCVGEENHKQTTEEVMSELKDVLDRFAEVKRKVDEEKCQSKAKANPKEIPNNKGEVICRKTEDRAQPETEVDSLISRNFINKCKAERLSYVSAFIACVNRAMLSLLKEEESVTGCEVKIEHSVESQFSWPDMPDSSLDQYDEGEEEEEEEEEDDHWTSFSRGGHNSILIAPPTNQEGGIWQMAQIINKKWWGMDGNKNMKQAAGRSRKMKNASDENIFAALAFEPILVPPQYPTYNINSIVSVDGKGQLLKTGVRVQGWTGGVISPLQIFLSGNFINLRLNQHSQALSFHVYTTTSLALMNNIGRKFAESIEGNLRSSLKGR